MDECFCTIEGRGFAGDLKPRYRCLQREGDFTLGPDGNVRVVIIRPLANPRIVNSLGNWPVLLVGRGEFVQQEGRDVAVLGVFETFGREDTLCVNVIPIPCEIGQELVAPACVAGEFKKTISDRSAIE